MPGADDKQLKDFQGLPLSELIIDPLVSAAKGQKKLAGVTLDFVSSIGFEPDPDDPKKTRTRTVDVEVELEETQMRDLYKHFMAWQENVEKHESALDGKDVLWFSANNGSKFKC